MLEFIDGVMYNGVRCRSLRELLGAGWRPGLEEALGVVRMIGEALSYAHEKRDLLHLDVKPENILVSSSWVFKLSDWGLAKAVRLGGKSVFRSTATGSVYATIEYAPPEMLDESLGKPGPWSDVYMLGEIAYELLTGEKPFTGSIHEVLVAKSLGRIKGLRTLNPSVPESVEKAVMKALNPDPGKRYQSVRDFIAALERALGGTAGMARKLERALTRSTGVSRILLENQLRQALISHYEYSVRNRDYIEAQKTLERLIARYKNKAPREELEKLEKLAAQLQRLVSRGVDPSETSSQITALLWRIEEHLSSNTK